MFRLRKEHKNQPRSHGSLSSHRHSLTVLLSVASCMTGRMKLCSPEERGPKPFTILVRVVRITHRSMEEFCC